MSLTYKQIKWLILIIPTVTIGLWEYVRHEFLLPYISMELGNLLAPVLVLFVTLLFSTQLFNMIEHIQEELNKAKAIQAVLTEREKLAQQLHDGIAQTLFFLNVQLNDIEKKHVDAEIPINKLKEIVYRANDYVRQAIANLRNSADALTIPWLESVESLISEIIQETKLKIITSWNVPEVKLNAKEKIELLAILRESLLNIYKHAQASQVTIHTDITKSGWICKIIDDGVAFDPNLIQADNHYGLRIMKDRAASMNWTLVMKRVSDQNIIQIVKGDD